jgi:aryl-alcohol dehydrogenase-like predicted oxidoreductase
VGGHFGHQRLGADPLLARLATKYTYSPHRIALAWLLHKGDHILPIPGASKPASILDSLKALELTLEPSDIEAIDRLPRA